MNKSTVGFGARLRYAWQFVPSLNRSFQPVRVSAILAILMPVTFLSVPQGKDILSALGDREHLEDHDFWFLGGLMLFGLMNWYGPRVLLNFDFDKELREDELRSRFRGDPSGLQKFHRLETFLERHLPRLLGSLPIAVIGLALVRLSWVNPNDAGALNQVYRSLGVLSLLGAVSLHSFFVVRRHMLSRFDATAMAGTPSSKSRYHSLKDLTADRSALLGLFLFTLPPTLIGVAFTFATVPVGFALGSGAVLLFGFGGWSCAGSMAIYFGHRWHLPTLTLAALLVLVASLNNDNHDIRTISSPQGFAPAPSLHTSLEQWHANIVANYRGEKSHPLFIVATEGGGIRAGYWTALVLGTLAEKPSPFADHVFAISGVSGGSLGAATFAVMRREQSQETAQKRVRALLGKSFLAPLVGKMLFPDLWQRFLPWPFPSLDRARALENAWSSADPYFSRQFSDLYKTPNEFLPQLFLNGTEVETGKRIITSTVAIEPGIFPEALDGVEKMQGHAISIATAVDASARFTYFSPAGRYPDGNHVVDGGYYENSGSSTAREILDYARKISKSSGWTDIRFCVIIIRNGEDAAKKPPIFQHQSHEIAAPLDALLNVREAHSQYATAVLKEEVGKENWFEFNLTNSQTSVPLGWALSTGAMDEMDFQVDVLHDPARLGRVKNPAKKDKLRVNSEVLEAVLEVFK